MHKLGPLLVVATTLFACKENPTPQPAAPVEVAAPGQSVLGSCDSRTTDSQCAEFLVTPDDDKPSRISDAKQICPRFEVDGRCVKTKEVGTCRVPEGVIVHYYEMGLKAYTSISGVAECKQIHGTWTGQVD